MSVTVVHKHHAVTVVHEGPQGVWSSSRLNIGIAVPPLCASALNPSSEPAAASQGRLHLSLWHQICQERILRRECCSGKDHWGFRRWRTLGSGAVLSLSPLSFPSCFLPWSHRTSCHLKHCFCLYSKAMPHTQRTNCFIPISNMFQHPSFPEHQKPR